MLRQDKTIQQWLDRLSVKSGTKRLIVVGVGDGNHILALKNLYSDLEIRAWDLVQVSRPVVGDLDLLVNEFHVRFAQTTSEVIDHEDFEWVVRNQVQVIDYRPSWGKEAVDLQNISDHFRLLSPEGFDRACHFIGWTGLRSISQKIPNHFLRSIGSLRSGISGMSQSEEGRIWSLLNELVTK